MKNKIYQKIVLCTTLLAVVCLSILFFMQFIRNVSVGADNSRMKLEVNLDKYINYNISDQDKGTLIQYDVKVGNNEEELREYIPTRESELNIGLNQIDGKYPYDVKVVAKSTEATNGKTEEIQENYQYDNTTGTVVIKASNENENGEPISSSEPSKDAKDEYLVICYYDTYIEQPIERELDIKISVKASLFEDDRLASAEYELTGKVKENIGELTNISYNTPDIANGYIKSNIINGTNYDTVYTEKQSVLISKKESQEKIKILENNNFVKTNNNNSETEIDVENKGDLVYKSTKIRKSDVTRVLGLDGEISILDNNQNLIATINKNTEFEQDGTVTINYENEPQAIIIKTSNIQNEGILNIENTKVIKSSMLEINNSKIKTVGTLIGVRSETTNETEQEIEVYSKEYENKIDIKDSKTNVTLEVNNDQWTNKQQNEITFDVYTNANTINDNMLKNPKIKIELPSQVEKVILGNSSVVYANGLELQDPYLETSKNGNIVIVANLVGEQTSYNDNALGLITDVKISATVILKKDIESTTGNVNLVYTNQYTIDGKEDAENRSNEIKITSYQEENMTEANSSIATYAKTSLLNPTVENIEGLTVEVKPIRGDTVLKDGDTVYEGEFIKYNITVTNTSDEQIDDIKIVGSIPDGTTYGELEADYHSVYGTPESRYEYIFYEDTKIKEIELGALEKGESVSAFYEVKVKDMIEEQTEQRILTSIKISTGETEVASYELNNVIKPAEAKIFIKSFLGSIKHQWQYHVCVESDEKKDTVINLKVPKGFELYSVFDNEEKIDILEKTEISEDGQNIAINIQTNKEYILYYYIKPSQLEQKTKDSKVELVVTASVKMENTYRSNENRILFEYESVSISMTSPNEEEEVEYGAEINYEIRITSTGINNISDPGYSSIPIKITDFLPEEVKPVSIEYDKWEEVIIDDNEEEGYHTPTGKFTKSIVTEDIPTILKDSEGNKLPNIDLTLNIPYGETVVIKIKTTAGLVYNKTRIQNCATVSSYNDEVDTNVSNIVSHILLPFDYDEIPDEPSNPDEPSDPENPSDGDEKYGISGVAWIDENEDGKRQIGEELLNGITVMLVNKANSSAIQAKEVTDTKGAYHFSGLEEGNYIVIFNYDTDTYSVTEYKKTGVSNSTNSDAINKEITLMGTQTKVGITDTIALNASISNIDIGLIKNKICDLKLDKYISKVQVKTASGTKEYTYDNNQLAKVEIKSKEIQGATVVVTYKIVVTNEGELPAYVTKVVDYIPDGLDFSSDLNKSWMTTTNGELTNINIANQSIGAGESVELTLVLTKTMTSNSTGTFTNIAEIGEMSNSLGTKDMDSTPGNKVKTEDDYSEADLIISVSTGVVIYISVGIALVLLMSVIVYVAFRYGTLKFRKIFLFGMVFIITIITTTTGTLAATRREFHYDEHGSVTGYKRTNSKGETVYTGFYAYNPGNSGGIKAECQEIDKPVSNTIDHYEWYVTDPSFNEYTYYYDETISGSSTFKMSKVTNTGGIGIHETQNGKLLLGPFMFNLTDSVTGKNKEPNFQYLITMSNNNEISGTTAYDINGNQIKIKASTSLYFEIPNEQKEYGIKSVRIDGNHEGLIEKEITYGGYLIYRADRVNYKDVQIIKTTDIIEEFEDIEVDINPGDYCEWTEFNGGLEIIKTDKETGKGLEGVTFNVTGPSYPNGHTITTESNGKTKVMNNLLVGKYTITETSNPNYGYTVMVEKQASITSGKTVIYEADNQKQTGNLHIEKKDYNNQKLLLKEISFKIKNSDGDYVIATDSSGEYKGKKVTKTISLTNMTITTNPDEATTFTTNDKGEINILNMLTGEYLLEETSVGNNFGYDEDGEYITYEYTTTNKDGKKETKRGEGNDIPFTITRQPSTETGVAPDTSDIKYSNVLNVYNKKKYIKLSGYAWEDIVFGKNSERIWLYSDNLNDNQDKKLNNVVVNLYKENGVKLDTERITGYNKNGDKIEDGSYVFGDYINEPGSTKIKIDDLKGAYIQFEYNGLNYQTIDLSNQDYIEKVDGKSIKVENANTAVEFEETKSGYKDLREEFNNGYAVIENNCSKKEVGGKATHTLTYDSENHASYLNYGKSTRKGYDGATYPIITNVSNSTYKDQFYISARTETNTDPNNYRLLGQNKTIEEIRKEGKDTIENINLGLYQRAQPDLALTKDIYSAKVTVNGYEHTYMYNQKFVDKDPNKDEFDVDVKFEEKIGNESFTRAIYPSDVKETQDKDFSVKVVYIITLKNGSGVLYSKINSLVDYFDARYDIEKEGAIWTISEKEDGTEDKVNIGYEVSEQSENNYKKMIINCGTNINPSERNKNIYVEYTLTRNGVKDILFDKNGNQKTNIEGLENIVEINSYSTYSDKDFTKSYAGIDSNSNPGSTVPGNKDTYEDDTDYAPGLILEVANSREIKGTVFEDNAVDPTAGGVNNERLGNGIFDDGEKTISGVQVRLYKGADFDKIKDEDGKIIDMQLKSEAKPVGTTTYEGDNKDSTGKDGTFTIKDFAPGEYRIVYFWGDGKYTIEDYKSTIWISDNKKEKDGNPNTWYRVNTDKRYSDALDNYDTRLKIDRGDTSINKMDSKTPTMVFGVELADDIDNKKTETSGIDKVTFSIENIDFGVIERPRQSIDVTKRVKSMKVTLANGQVIADAKIIEKDGKLQLEEQAKGVAYIQPSANASPKNGMIKAEIDNELIQGATVEIKYEIKVQNNSEIDYDSKGYYCYGEKGEEIVKIKASGVYDYLDNTMIANDENTEWETKTIEKYNEEVSKPTVIEEYLHKYQSSSTDASGNTEIRIGYEKFEEQYSEAKGNWKIENIITARKKRLADKTILHNANLEGEIAPGDSKQASLTASKILTNTDEIELNNDIEITEATRNKRTRRNVTPQYSIFYDKGETVTITAPTGENKNYILITIVAISFFVILGTGVVFIKKKILK